MVNFLKILYFSIQSSEYTVQASEKEYLYLNISKFQKRS